MAVVAEPVFEVNVRGGMVTLAVVRPVGDDVQMNPVGSGSVASMDFIAAIVRPVVAGVVDRPVRPVLTGAGIAMATGAAAFRQVWTADINRAAESCHSCCQEGMGTSVRSGFAAVCVVAVGAIERSSGQRIIRGRDTRPGEVDRLVFVVGNTTGIVGVAVLALIGGAAIAVVRLALVLIPASAGAIMYGPFTPPLIIGIK